MQYRANFNQIQNCKQLMQQSTIHDVLQFELIVYVPFYIRHRPNNLNVLNI